jgi:hypothetical protein
MSCAPRSSARRPNGRRVVMNVESRGRHRQGGFRRPCRCVVVCLSAARDHERRCAYPGVCRSTHLRGSARSFLKMKRGDPSHSRISAAVGLVMPAHLEGATIGIGDKVRPCTSLVDQFWIRSAIHSHGSTPDRKSRAVPRCERGRAGSLRRQTQPRDALNACSKGWREHRCDIKCRPEDRRRWRVSGTPGDERRQSHGTCTTKKTSGPLPQGLRLFRLRNGA